MSNSIRSDFHTDLAQTILEDVQYRRSNYYYFLGKNESWGNSDLAPAEMQTDSDMENTLIRSNCLYVKKITPNDVSLVIDRVDWVTETPYVKWDNTKNLESAHFYVVADDNVYKCLDNFGGSNSTVKPTGRSFYPVRTSDGYLWKYMYTVPSFKRSRFASLSYTPVQTALTDSFYNKGSVDAIVINNQGSGYVDVELTNIIVTGTTTGAGATGHIVVDGSGTVTSVVVDTGGTDYTSGVALTLNSSTGSGAVLVPVIVGGIIASVTVDSGGSGYLGTDTLVFSVGGASLVPKVSRVDGSITDVTVVNPGIGYVGPVTLSLTSTPDTGTGIYGNTDAVLTAIVYEGSIQRVTIEDPGINYPYDTATTIAVQGDGVDASFSPVVQDGKIVDVVVENPGEGYTSIVLTVVGAGTGADLTGIVSASDFQSDQSIVEQTAETGKIYAIEVSNTGGLYTNTTVVTVTGDGSECTAEAIIVNGEVFAIKVTNFGTGYTYASVAISDPSRVYFGTELNATAYAIFPPIGGHGKDAVTELYGRTLSINISLRTDTLVNALSQDYRQYGLLKNPREIVSGKSFTGTNSLVAFELEFDIVTGLVKDEVITFGSTKFRVADIDGLVVTVQRLGLAQVSPIGTFVAEADNARTYESKRVISYPIVDKYSGKLLYASNENPFSFTEEQGIIVKTFLKF